MVFDTVCADLENEGFKVIPVILPAASINAPHKRNRVFFIAHTNDKGGRSEFGGVQKENGEVSQWNNDAKLSNSDDVNATNSDSKMLEHGNGEGETFGRANKEKRIKSLDGARGWETFPTQSPICSGDDGLSSRLDSITFPKWRKESIKGYGNAVVPDLVAMIFKTIQEYENKFL
jgi:DNA (cytosine-5)-methyltransferase 1